MSAADLARRLLAAEPVGAIFRWALGGRLRIVAYHGIKDQAVFASHVAYVAEAYRPVDSDDVLAATRGAALPRRAVWLTFDDADPDVVELGLPVLDEAGFRGTMFVCPGVVDTCEPYWWQIVDAATSRGLHEPLADGLSATAFRRRLKRSEDGQRRAVVAQLREALDGANAGPPAAQITTSQLQRWLASGHTAGNHTWDHPLLDHCGAAEQVRQVADADDWLRQLTAAPVRLFAYPNGNAAPEADAELARRGYAPPLLFDHRCGRPSDDRLSRLRLDAFAGPERMSSTLSGAHPALHALKSAFRG